MKTRIGLLADIHGNARALEAVLRDAQDRQVTRWLNLGDIVYGPLEPRETYGLLSSVNAETVRGNEDREVLDASTAALIESPTLRYVIEDLGEEAIAWLRALPMSLSVDDVFACHGTPTHDSVYLTEDVSSGRPRCRSDQEIADRLRGVSASLVVCGHSHYPRVVRLHRGQCVVNPGSVGLPAYDDERPVAHSIETYGPDASYAVVERTQGDWRVEHIRVPYPHSLAAEQARRRGRPDWARWLMTGRA